MIGKTTYSFIYLSPDSRLGDRLAIGMLILQGHKLDFRYSKSKLNVLKSVLSDKYDLIKKSLASTQKYIENINPNANPLINPDLHLLSESYLQKLSVYNNGILQFSEPKSALLTEAFGVEEFFTTFFKEDELVKKWKEKDILKNVFNEKLISKVKDTMHTHIDLGKHFIPSLYFNYELDAIGKNGSIHIVKYFNFEEVQPAKVSHLIALNELIHRHFGLQKNNRVFIFGEEPAINNDNHTIYEYLQKNPSVTVYHPEEAGQKADELIENGVAQFLELV